jgi:hypothetical protein
MLNLMLSGPVPRKAGAKLLLFYKTTKFLHIFYHIIHKFLDFHVLTPTKTLFPQRHLQALPQYFLGRTAVL